MELIFFHAGDYREKTNKDGVVTQRLTPKAIRMTERAAEGIFRLRPKKCKIEVWSTLEPHTSHTANIIAEVLDIKAKLVNSIGNKDTAKLLKVLTEYSDEKCIILIGNSALFDPLAKKLTGIPLSFSTYSAAGFTFFPQEAITAQLLWYLSDTAMPRVR